MKLPELTKLMMLIAAEFPKTFEVNEIRMGIWMEVLKDESLEDAVQVFCRFMREARQFPPQVGEIYQGIQSLRTAKNISTDGILRLPDVSEVIKREPEPTPEQREKNLAMLKQLSKDLAAKKAMRQ